jgi:hypothetical protein
MYTKHVDMLLPVSEHPLLPALSALGVGKVVEITDTSDTGEIKWYSGTLHLHFGRIEGNVWLVKYDAVEGVQEGEETEEVILFQSNGDCKIWIEPEEGSDLTPQP